MRSANSYNCFAFFFETSKWFGFDASLPLKQRTTSKNSSSVLLLDALKRAYRRSSLQASRSARSRAIGVLRAVLCAENAHSRQRCWCLWSKPVNLGTS